MNNSELVFDNYLIAYIDILGYRNLISKFKSEEMFFNLIDNTLKNIFNEHNDFMLAVEYCIFSDNLIFGIKEDFWTKTNPSLKITYFEQFLTLICVIQYSFFTSSLLLRGGITIGKLYFDKNVQYVFGSGLIKAYDLENNHAKYPRIIIDNECKSIIYDFVSEISRLSLFCFDDEFFSLNYLSPVIELFANHCNDGDDEFNKVMIQNLYNHKIQILNYYNTLATDVKTKDKLKWLGKVHNNIIEKSNLHNFNNRLLIINDQDWNPI